MDLTYSNSAHYVKNPCTPKSQCFGARVGKSDEQGGWFQKVDWGILGLMHLTLTVNFGGEGVVSDRKGLNISSIYGMTGWLSSKG